MSTTRNNRYQEGSIDRVPRAKGPDVWVYRWRECREDGSRVQRKRVIGDLNRYPKRADAKRAIEHLRSEINAREERFGKFTVAEAWAHFQAHELRDPEIGRSPTTVDNYLALFRSHIIPRWGDFYLEDVKAVAVETWLRSLTSLAPASKAKIKSRMFTLFSHSIRHEMCKQNPMESVRQGSKRVAKPDILSLDEIRAIMAGISTPAIKLAVLVAAATGLRRSEIRGLKWLDIDFDTLWITPARGIVLKYETNLKTRASSEPIPISPALAEALIEWRRETPYPSNENWIFASPQTSGTTPYWFDSALRQQIQPAARNAGITKTIGWHTFRRSLATLLTTKKEGIKVVQELMRHANSKITMDVYAQGDEHAKRAAQEHSSGLFAVHEKAS